MIALFAEDPSVQKHIAKAGEIFIPAPVIGELYFGAFKSERAKANAVSKEYTSIPANSFMKANSLTPKSDE